MANNNINRSLSGIDPLAYMGINASGSYSASQTVVHYRAPTINDSKNFIIGCLWLWPDTDSPAHSAQIWMLTALLGNDATWTELVASGANGILTITGDSGGAVGPLLGNVNLVAGAGSGLSVVGNPGTYTLTIAGTGGGSVINQIDGDTGYVTGPTVSIKGNATAGSTVEFIGDNATAMTFNVTDADANTIMGQGSGNGTLTGTDNTGYGTENLTALTTGSLNTGIGEWALKTITTGSRNTALGYSSGFNYTGAESSNIVIRNTGVLGESNTIRIGTNGNGVGQQNRCFVAGVDGVNVGSVATVVTENANQLGTAVITAGSGITVTPSANAITIAATGAASYSTGTWTPDLAFGGASVGITYNYRAGAYTQIGNLVFITVSIVLTSKGVSVGQMQITNLPFTVTSAYSPPFMDTSPVSIGDAITLAAGYTSFWGNFIAGGTVLQFIQGSPSGSLQAAVTDVEMSNTSNFTVFGYYTI